MDIIDDLGAFNIMMFAPRFMKNRSLDQFFLREEYVGMHSLK